MSDCLQSIAQYFVDSYSRVIVVVALMSLPIPESQIKRKAYVRAILVTYMIRVSI